jgi:hypothetical protein
VAPGGGVISPPNTGEAGLAAETDGRHGTAYAVLGLLLVAATIGAVAIGKARA